MNPRKGHLERAKQVVGYLRWMNHGSIRVRTDKPDYSKISNHTYTWMWLVYGDVSKLIADDIPMLLGNPVVTTTYKDANLFHDFVTGRAVTGILHLVNQTPIDWFSKRQATVETAIHISEFVVA